MDLSKELEKRRQEIVEYDRLAREKCESVKGAIRNTDAYFDNLGAEQDRVLKAMQPQKPFNPSDYRVLIVEDEESVAYVMERMLGEKGYNFEVAENGRKALEKIESYNPHVAIIDNNMPIIKGEELIPILRADAKNSKLKLIASGQGFSEEVLAKCDGVIKKPYELIVVYSTLEKVLSE